MARTTEGAKDLAWSREQIATARSADELRHAQAVWLPLELGLSLEQNALAMGRSVSLTCKLRNRKRRERIKEIPVKKNQRELRSRATATLAREAALLDQVLAEAGRGGVVVMPRLKPAFEKSAGTKDCAVHTLSGACPPWLAQMGPRYSTPEG